MSEYITHKNKDRVKKLGEVFTPPHIVKEMCDLIGDDDPTAYTELDKTFLEPACGTGNFLVEILERRLKACKTPDDVIRALQGIYGVDIMEDNVKESRGRMYKMARERLKSFGDTSLHNEFLLLKVLATNIIIGDFLHGQDKIIFHDWKTGEDESLADMIRRAEKEKQAQMELDL